jgi:hypothetical protein
MRRLRLTGPILTVAIVVIVVSDALNLFAFAYALAHAADPTSIALAAGGRLPNAGYFFLAALSLGVAVGPLGIVLRGCGLVIAFVQMLLGLGVVGAGLAYLVAHIGRLSSAGPTPSRGRGIEATDDLEIDR